MTEVFEQFRKTGIIPVVVLDDAHDAAPLSKALIEGGLPCAEVTFRTDAAAEAIGIMSHKFPGLLVGAGTVLTPGQAEQAIEAGAKFIVSPGLNPDVVKYCIDRDVPVTPGTQTPTEMEAAQDVEERLSTRTDRFKVMKTLRGASMKEIEEECLKWYGGVVILGGDEVRRSQIVEFCVKHYIRVFMLPRIGDLLIQSTEYMDLFDIPLLELKEYSISWESRLVKRLVDLAVGILFLPFLLAVMLVKRIRGERLQKEEHVGKHGKSFYVYTYASWPRQMPELLNLLNGTMSLVGPVSVAKADAAALMKQSDWYSYRNRVKPGITGYAQLCATVSTPPEDVLKMDIYYIQHYSLMNDFQLMLQSVRRLWPSRRR